MHVLVTGGAGFIGSHLVDKLIKEKCKVSVLDNFSTGCRNYLPNNIKIFEMDICNKEIIKVFEDEKFDAIVHLAGQTMVKVSTDEPYYDAGMNILGGINILECCRRTNVQRVVFSSTAAVYGEIERSSISEKDCASPASFYGLSKKTFEKYLELYFKLFALEYMVLRFSNVYGERQGEKGEGSVISIFAKKIAKDVPINIYGNGNQTRDFIYVGDVVNAIWKTLNTNCINRLFNISTNTETSINHLIKIFSDISNKKIQCKYKLARKGDIFQSVLDNNQAVKMLQWNPSVSFKEGLERTYQYFLDVYM